MCTRCSSTFLPRSSTGTSGESLRCGDVRIRRVGSADAQVCAPLSTASIRRVLVITLEAAKLPKEGAWATECSSAIFHSSMIELGLLGLLILVVVVSITLLRRCAPASKDLSEL